MHHQSVPLTSHLDDPYLRYQLSIPPRMPIIRLSPWHDSCFFSVVIGNDLTAPFSDRCKLRTYGGYLCRCLKPVEFIDADHQIVRASFGEAERSKFHV